MGRMLHRMGACALVSAALATVARPVAAQTLTDKLAIHGFLTQGYATADSHQIAGIPRGGTFDYRRAAVLLRIKATPNDAFVVQLANRELGASPIDAFSPDVQMDWAFYERRLGSKTTLRIGKAPIPMGIFNETRYVGTLLPFYRAPLGFYQEGSFTSETLNGLVLTRQLTSGSAWKLSGSLFGGGFDYLQSGRIIVPGDSSRSYTVMPAVVKNLIGTQLWLQTPVSGLRVGLGGDRRDDYGKFYGATPSTHGTKEWWASVDGSFDRLTARAEYRQFSFKSGAIHVRSYYGQIGYRILEALSINVQRDVMDVRFDLPNGEFRIPYNRDNAIGVNYMFSPNTVAKFEVHNDRGFSSEEPLDVLHGSSVRSNYLITSVSVSF